MASDCSAVELETGEVEVMATFNHAIEVGPKDGARFQRVIARVDPLSAYTAMPGSLLTMLGIEPEWSQQFELADGRREERSVAEARVKIDGQERTTICVFGQPESEPVLGAYTLTGFGLQVDTAGQGLVPAQLFLG